MYRLLSKKQIAYVYLLAVVFVLLAAALFMFKPTSKISIDTPYLKELTSERTENTQTFLRNDNKLVQRVYSDQVNYKKNGKWRKINTDFIDSGDILAVKSAPYSLTMGKYSTQAVEFKKGNFHLKFIELEANKVLGKIYKNSVSYIGAYSNTALVRQAANFGIKQSYLLKQPGHPKIFKQKLTSNLNPSIAKDGSIQYLGNSGKVIFKTPAPTILDKNGLTRYAKYQLDGSILSVVLPNLEGLKYPLVVDPSITTTVKPDNGVISYQKTLAWNGVIYGPYINVNSNPTDILNVGVWASRWAQTSTAYNTDYANLRSFMRFNLSSVTGNIQSVNLKINYTNHYTYGSYNLPGVLLDHIQDFGNLDSADWDIGAYANSIATVVDTSTPAGLRSIDVTNRISNDRQASRNISAFRLKGSSEFSSPPSSSLANYYQFSPNFVPYWQDVYDPYGYYVIGQVLIEPSNPPYLEFVTVIVNTPTNPQISSVAKNSVDLSWNDSPGNASSYTIEKSTDGTNFSIAATVSGDTTSYTINSLIPNTRYWFRIKATNLGFSSGYASAGPKYTLVDKPASLAVSIAGANSLKVDWQAPLNGPASGYKVFSSSNSYSSPVYEGTALTYTEPGLNQNVTYTYRVFAVNSENITGLDYAESSHRLLSPPTDVRISSVETNSASINWTDNSNEETSYTVEKSTNGTTFSVIASSLPSDSNSYVAGSLTPNTRYWFRVKANNDNGASSYVITQPKYTLADKPSQINSYQVNQNSIKIFWIVPSNGAASYKVYSSSNNYSTVKYEGPANTFIESGLNIGTTYNYKIYSLNGDSAVNPDFISTSQALSQSNLRIVTWTTKADFENNSSTTGQTTSRENVQITDSGEVELLGADDSTQASLMLFWDGASIPPGWTEVSANGQPFYQKLIRGNTSYGDTGGSTTHNHSSAVSFSTSTVSGVYDAIKNPDRRSVSDGRDYSHSHSIGAIATSDTSNLPSYKNLKVIKYNNGIPSSIPSGAIGIFNSASLPNGWTRYSQLDNYYARGETSDIGAAYNAPAHSHNFSGSSSAYLNYNESANDVAWGTPYYSFHYHNFSFGSGSSTVEVPYITAVYAKANSDTSLPAGLVAMLTNNVPAATWLNLSEAGSSYNQKFVKASATPNTINNNQHIHSFSGTTSNSLQNGGQVGYAGSGPNYRWPLPSSHTHTLSGSSPGPSALPPYIDVIFAKKVSNNSTSGTIGGTGTTVGLKFDSGPGYASRWSLLDAVIDGNPSTSDNDPLLTDQAVKFLVKTSDNGSNWTIYGRNGQQVSDVNSAFSNNYFGQVSGGQFYSTPATPLPLSRHVDLIVRLEGNGNNTPALKEVNLINDNIPETPSSMQITSVDKNSVDLSWADNATDEVAYFVEQSSDGINYSQIAVLPSDSTNYTADLLTPNTKYWFKVKCMNQNGGSDYAVSTPKYTLADLASSASATRDGDGSIEITWDKPVIGTTSSYRLFSSSNNYSAPKYSGNEKLFIESGLAYGLYNYRIYTVNGDNIVSPDYIETSITINPFSSNDLRTLTWTTKDDFENNASTTSQATSRDNITTTSSGDVTLTNFVDPGTGAQGDITIEGTHNINEYISGYNPDSGVVPNFNNLTVNGTLTTSPGVRLEFKVKGTLTVNGLIDVSGKGYAAGSGSGAGGNGVSYYDYYASGGGGGGYGGAGGRGTDYVDPYYGYVYANGGAGGSSYSAFPSFGSSGGNGGYASYFGGSAGAGGAGGGSIKIPASSIALNGQISANGYYGGNSTSYNGSGGGGSGGSIFILSASSINASKLSAVGGNGGTVEYGRAGGGGGGGRITVIAGVTGSGLVYGGQSNGNSGVYNQSGQPGNFLGVIGGSGSTIGLRYDAGSGIRQKWSGLDYKTGPLLENQAVKFAFKLSNDGINWSGPYGRNGTPINWTSGSGNYLGRAYGDPQKYIETTNMPYSRYIDIIVKLEGIDSSPILHEVTLNAPTAPTNTTISSVTKNSAILTWKDNADNETNYIVEMSTNGSDFSPLATLPANSVSYTANSLNPNIRYWFRVCSMINSNTSDYSVTEPKYTKSDTPRLPEAIPASDTSIKVYWQNQALGTAAGYRLYSSSNNFSTPVYEGADKQFTESSLTSGLSYTYNIYSLNGDGLESDEFATVIAAVSPPATPTEFKGEAQSQDSIRWSWKGNPNAENYVLHEVAGSNLKRESWIQTTDSQFNADNKNNTKVVGSGDAAKVQLDALGTYYTFNTANSNDSASSASGTVSQSFYSALPFNAIDVHAWSSYFSLTGPYGYVYGWSSTPSNVDEYYFSFPQQPPGNYTWTATSSPYATWSKYQIYGGKVYSTIYTIPMTSGSLTSGLIQPTNFGKWGRLSYNKSDGTNGGPATSSITIDVLSSSGAVLKENVANETDLNTLPELTGVSTIKLRANLSSETDGNNPELYDWSVEYYRARNSLTTITVPRNTDGSANYSYIENDLDPNSGVSRHIHAVNVLGESISSQDIAAFSLPETPAVKPSSGTSSKQQFVFTNYAGGTSDWGTGHLDHYHWIWDQNKTRTRNEIESSSNPAWNSNSLTTNSTRNGFWYLHLVAHNVQHSASSTVDLGPYYFNISPPPPTSNSITINATESVGMTTSRFGGYNTTLTAPFKVGYKSVVYPSIPSWNFCEFYRSFFSFKNWGIPSNSTISSANLVLPGYSTSTSYTTTPEISAYEIPGPYGSTSWGFLTYGAETWDANELQKLLSVNYYGTVSNNLTQFVQDKVSSKNNNLYIKLKSIPENTLLDGSYYYGQTSNPYLTINYTNPSAAKVTDPSADKLVSGLVDIKGTAYDPNLTHYVVKIEQQGGSPSVVADNDYPVTDDTLTRFNSKTVADGLYRAQVTVYESSGYSLSAYGPYFNIDNTAPVTSLEQLTGEYQSGLISFRGSVSDTNLKDYKLQYSNQSDPATWTTFATFKEQHLSTSYIGKLNSSKLPNGDYNFRMLASDVAGNEIASNTVTGTIDNPGEQPFDDANPAWVENHVQADLSPSQITTINESNPDAAGGNSGSITVGRSYNGSKSINSLVAFNLASVVPKNVVVDKAYLEVGCTVPQTGVGRYGITELTGDWNANTSWNTRPSTGSYLYGNTLLNPGQGGTGTPTAFIDLTNQLNKWQNGQSLNYGLLFSGSWSYGGWPSPQPMYYSSINLNAKFHIYYHTENPDLPESSVTNLPDNSFVKGNKIQIKGNASVNTKKYGVYETNSYWQTYKYTPYFPVNYSSVFGVEVSTDNGNSWRDVDGGKGSWIFNWINPADGIYKIKTRSKDSFGFIELMTAKQGGYTTVTVDNTLPQAAINSPSNGEQIEKDQTIEVIGTASDYNFDYYYFEIGSGDNPTEWKRIGANRSPAVINDLLAKIRGKYFNGPKTLKLTVADKAGNTSSASVLLNTTGTEPTNPHTEYSTNTDLCAYCHSAHTAPMKRLLTRLPDEGMSVSDFCYTCHDGSGSKYNIKTAVDDNPSHHPVKDAKYNAYYDEHPEKPNIQCTDCHNPHGYKIPNGNGAYSKKLLAARDTKETADPADDEINYEGNKFCYTCHGPNTINVGGDLSSFGGSSGGSSHNISRLKPVSGTQIACSGCHENSHGDKYSWMLPKNEEELCFECHGKNPTDSRSATNPANLQAFSQFTSKKSKHDVFSSTGAKVECINCHGFCVEPSNKMADPNNTRNRWAGTKTGFCLACHNDNPPQEIHNASSTVPYSVVFPDTNYLITDAQWIQTDWSGGPGQESLLLLNKFNSSTDIDFSTAGEIKLSSGKTEGNLISSFFDSSDYNGYVNLFFTTDLPAGTNVKFQVGAYGDQVVDHWVDDGYGGYAVYRQAYRGPDGTENTYYLSTGDTIWKGYEGKDLCYKVYLTSEYNTVSPKLLDVKITSTDSKKLLSSFPGWSKDNYITSSHSRAYGCDKCHNSHASDQQRLLALDHNEQIGVSNICLQCHKAGGPANAADIATTINTSAYLHYKNNDASSASKHRDYEQYPDHIACEDCHNPHEANDIDTPGVKGANKGASGIDFYGNIINPITNDAYMCYKCHKDDTFFRWIYTQPANPRPMYGSKTVNYAEEFSPSMNKSGHPIYSSPKYGPDPNKFTTIAKPGQKMGCSDCHDELHGSYNPFRAGGITPANFTIPNDYAFKQSEANPRNTSPLVNNLCYKCHRREYYAQGKDLQGNIVDYRHANVLEGVAGTGGHSFDCLSCHRVHSSEYSYLLNGRHYISGADCTGTICHPGMSGTGEAAGAVWYE